LAAVGIASRHARLIGVEVRLDRAGEPPELCLDVLRPKEPDEAAQSRADIGTLHVDRSSSPLTHAWSIVSAGIREDKFARHPHVHPHRLGVLNRRVKPGDDSDFSENQSPRL
jgi:hypothetical protein